MTMIKPRTSESDLQATVIAGLRYLGFRVLSTSRVRRRCQHCGQVSHAGDGVDKGLPDLLVTRDDWPGVTVTEGGIVARPCWTGIELKAERGRLSPAQQELLDAGRIVVARSWSDVEAALKGGGSG